MTLDEVSALLYTLDLSPYVAMFRQNDVDGKLLSSLDANVLVDDFAFSHADAHRLLKYFATVNCRTVPYPSSNQDLLWHALSVITELRSTKKFTLIFDEKAKLISSTLRIVFI